MIMENVPKYLKIVASLLIALVIGFIFVGVLFGAVGLNIKDFISFRVTVIVLVMSFPFYVIIRKKLFK